MNAPTPDAPRRAQASSDADERPVLVAREGGVVHVTLNRPRAINALNLEMFEALGEALAEAAGDGSGAILLDGAGERGFCGGGDIKAMAAEGGAAAPRILEAEYAVDYGIATSPVPVVGVMDGITMGGGVGLTGHAAMRVVTERSRLAMPEVRIGIVPDVGGHLLLARAPGRLGELLAITAGTMGPGDAIALGFADRFVPSERLPELGVAMRAGRPPAEAVAAVAEAPPEAGLLADREWFDPIADEALGGAAPGGAAQRDPAASARRLVDLLEASADERARETGATVRRMCPVSVAVTLEQIARTRERELDLRAVLDDDLRVLSRLTARDDFAEGVRAQVIDKDQRPRWRPADLDGLDAETVAGLLAE